MAVDSLHSHLGASLLGLMIYALIMALHHRQRLRKQTCPTEDGISSNVLVPVKLDPPPSTLVQVSRSCVVGDQALSF